VLTAHPQITAFYETTVLLYAGAPGSSPDPGAVKAANFIQSEVLRDVHTSGLTADVPVSPGQVAELLRLVDRGTISGKQAKEVYALMRGTSTLPSAIVRERKMSVISDEAQLLALSREIVAQNPKQADSYRAGKANLLGFFVGQIMKQTGGSADPAVVNRVLKRVLAGEAEAGSGEKPAETPENTGVHEAFRPPALRDSEGRSRRDTGEVRSPGRGGALMPISPTPRSGTRDREDQSPLAQSVAPPAPPPLEHTTLTSASGAAAVAIPGPPAAPAIDGLTPEAFARFDVRVGRVVTAARVPRKDKLLDLSVDVGDIRGPRRIVAGLALSYAPEELLGKRVLVVCNIEPRDFGRGYVSEGMILTAGPTEGLALATVTEDIPPGTRVK
jgi:methionine--tRNA ligase beta chain